MKTIFSNFFIDHENDIWCQLGKRVFFCRAAGVSGEEATVQRRSESRLQKVFQIFTAFAIPQFSKPVKKLEHALIIS